jgi:hypothetical protein
MPFGRYIRQGEPPSVVAAGGAGTGGRRAAGGRWSAAPLRPSADGVSRGTWDAHHGPLRPTPHPLLFGQSGPPADPSKPRWGADHAALKDAALTGTALPQHVPLNGHDLSAVADTSPAHVRQCDPQVRCRRSSTGLAITGPDPQSTWLRRPGRPAVHFGDQHGRPPSCGHGGHSDAHPGHRLRTWAGQLAASPTTSDRPTDQSRRRLHGVPAPTRVARSGVRFGAGRLNRSRITSPTCTVDTHRHSRMPGDL